MSNGYFKVDAENEPVKALSSRSPERASLKKRTEPVRTGCSGPMIIGKVWTEKDQSS